MANKSEVCKSRGSSKKLNDYNGSYISPNMDSKAYISTNQSQDAVIISARPTETRQPVHLIFVVDTSDSMDGERLDSVNQSIQFIVPYLTSQDLVSVITFGDNSEIILKQAPPVSLMAVNLNASGCTNMSAALLNVKDCIGTSLKEGVLLLTDGHANTGIYTVDGLKSIILSLGTPESLSKFIKYMIKDGVLINE